MIWRRRGNAVAVEQGPRPPGAWRARALLGLMLVTAGAVLARAFYLQVVDDQFLTAQGNKRFIRTEVLQAHRGAILDRHGETLALSAPVDSIWAVPDDLLASPQYLPALAKLLEQPLPRLKAYLRARRERQFVYLVRQVDPAGARRFLALGAPGLFAQHDYRRYYPAGEVAAQVIGFCNIDGDGQEGIELADNRQLAGRPGRRRVIRDSRDRVVEDAAQYQAARPGQDLRLTIDLPLQYVAYRELKRAVEEHHARAGVIVIADARNGQILALASQPGYNPNRQDDRASAGVRDRALTDVFEPGSTIKPLLIATALNHRVVDAGTRIETDPGTFEVGSLTVHDVHSNGVVDLAKLLQKSSNVGAAKVGLMMGPQMIWRGYQAFGIGQPLSIDLPGAADGVLRPWTDWGQIATATAAYGYGLSVNALQLLRAYSVLADDGLMPQLHIRADVPPVPPQRVIPAAIARQLRQMLTGVVSDQGTAALAAVPGYSVAGKTGTSRIAADGGYVQGEYRALFAGMLPAQQPRLVGVVVIDDPKGMDYYGGSVSGPVFSRVMRSAARMLQVAPDQIPAGVPTRTATLEAVRGHS
ncbi:MAG: penicillin-binding protein 2 [Gammaproteobacteria bacterium]|nr:penicillin-binding protein 2 [Gammaproteobacteria bacterium]